VQRVEYGIIEQLRPVKIEGTKTPIGAGAGAAVGGIAGSSIRGGKTGQVMAVIGTGVEITLKMDDGRTIAVVQGLSPNERYSVGDRVRVISSGQATRVSR
jgi:outer membrane lipoprotein SlyB